MATNRVAGKGSYRIEEYKAASAGIYPGMLVKLDANGEVAIHDDEGGALGDEVMIAAEDALQGHDVDEVYADDSRVTVFIPNKGSTVNVLIEDGQDIDIADKLISAGNGKFKVSTDLESGETLSCVPGIATEVRDLTGSDSDDTLSEMRVV